MASASNSFNIVGNLSRDIEIRLTTKQTKYCWITVAVNKIGKDKGADFIDILVWDKMADNLKKYCTKGDCIAVQGSISVVKDKEGHNKIQHDVTEGAGITLATIDDGIMSGGPFVDQGYVAPVYVISSGIKGLCLLWIYGNKLGITNCTGSTLTHDTTYTVFFGSMSGDIML